MSSGKLAREVEKMQAEADVLSAAAGRADLPQLVCVDDNGIILDDGSEAAKPWVGKPISDLAEIYPQTSVPLQVIGGPDPLQIIRGIDPLQTAGLKLDSDVTNRPGAF